MNLINKRDIMSEIDGSHLKWVDGIIVVGFIIFIRGLIGCILSENHNHLFSLNQNFIFFDWMIIIGAILIICTLLFKKFKK